MGKINLSLLCASLVAMIVLGCRYELEVPYEAPSFSNTCTIDTIYYAQMIAPVLSKSCGPSGCHDAKSKKADVDFSTHYATLQALRPGKLLVSELYKVLENNPLHHAAMLPVSLEDKERIFKWIEQGAHNNSCTDIETCDTTNVTFGQFIQPRIGICKSCHKLGLALGGIDLSTYEKVKVYVDNGKFLGSIQRRPHFSPMPKNMNGFSLCTVNKIRAWINAGAKKN